MVEFFLLEVVTVIFEPVLGNDVEISPDIPGFSVESQVLAVESERPCAFDSFLKDDGVFFGIGNRLGEARELSSVPILTPSEAADAAKSELGGEAAAVSLELEAVLVARPRLFDPVWDDIDDIFK